MSRWEGTPALQAEGWLKWSVKGTARATWSYVLNICASVSA